MGSKGEEYQIIYRGQSLGRYFPGQWAFFQRPKECGGGYWLGRVYDDCFWLELQWPVSLRDGLIYMIKANKMIENANNFDDEFTLEP